MDFLKLFEQNDLVFLAAYERAKTSRYGTITKGTNRELEMLPEGQSYIFRDKGNMITCLRDSNYLFFFENLGDLDQDDREFIQWIWNETPEDHEICQEIWGLPPEAIPGPETYDSIQRQCDIANALTGSNIFPEDCYERT